MHVWGETPIVASPIVVRLSLFLISPHSENLIYLTLAVLKFKNLEEPIEGDPSKPASRFLSHKSPDIFNLSNFETRAFSGLKVDIMRKRKKKKTKKKDAKQEKHFSSWGNRT